MNAIQFALARRQLQAAAAEQRDALGQHTAGLAPLCAVADRIQRGAHWIRRHPEVAAGSLAVLAAARPGVRRLLWKWGKRTFVAWKLWRNLRHSGIAPHLPLPRPHRASRRAAGAGAD